MHVRGEALCPRLVRIICKHHARVLHERGHVRCLATRCRCHVEHTLSRLGGQSNDREERGGGLQHVVTGEVFGGRTDRHATLEYLQANVCPFANGLEIDTTIDEGLREVAPPCAEGVRSDGDRSGNLIRLKELDRLAECALDKDQLIWK